MHSHRKRYSADYLAAEYLFILLNFSEDFYRLEDLHILYTIAYIPLIGK